MEDNMNKPLEKLFFDYFDNPIPPGEAEHYYEDGNMSLQSMKDYENYFKELANKGKSAKDFLFQEKDKLLFSLGKYKLDI